MTLITYYFMIYLPQMATSNEFNPPLNQRNQEEGYGLKVQTEATGRIKELMFDAAKSVSMGYLDPDENLSRRMDASSPS